MNLRSKTISGLKWTTTSSVLNSLFQIIQLIILAQILSPADFGLIALTMVVVGFSDMFIDMGFSNAIIYKKEVSNNQLSSLYWINVLLGLVFFLIVNLLAPLISIFFGESKLISLIGLVSITFLIKPLGQQFMVLLQKEMNFNNLATTNIISRLISFTITIVAAYSGFGVYSIAYGAISYSLGNTIGYINFGFKLNRPEFHFSLTDIREFWSFGLFQMGEKLLNYFSAEADTLIIGRLLGVEYLGVYSVAKDLAKKPSTVINPIITKVTFPLMSKIDGGNQKLKEIFLNTIMYLSYINVPIHLLLIILASPLIIFLFGPQWIDSILILQILSMTYLLRSIGNPTGSLVLSKGKANLLFYWNLASSILYPISVLIGSFWGIVGISIATLILQIILYIPNLKFIINRVIDIHFMEYFTKTFKPLYINIIPLVFAYITLNSLNIDYYILVFIPILYFGTYILVLYKGDRDFFQLIINK